MQMKTGSNIYFNNVHIKLSNNRVSIGLKKIQTTIKHPLTTNNDKIINGGECI